MPQPEQTYTYRAGQKIALVKQPDQFVVRALPEELESMGITDAEQVSSASSRVITRTTDLETLMAHSRHIAPTHHAYALAATGEEFLITDRVFVTFKQSPTAEELGVFAGRYSLVLLTTYGPQDYLFQLTDHTGMNPVKLVVKLMEEEPLVASAEHDLNQRMNKYVLLPTDPAYARQWHLHPGLIDPAFNPLSSSRCEASWQLLDQFGSRDVVVGVTDDGCKLDHPDFASPGKFAGWGYFRRDRLITQFDIDANPSEMYQPGANHGTSCAGVIAGDANAVLTVGAAPGCRLLPIQWESSGPSLFISDSKLLTALNYLADRVDIVSNSWGSVPTSLWVPQVVNRITELARTGGRRGQGIVFLWAAGNDNCPIQHTAAVDVPYTDGWGRRPDGSGVWVGVETARQFQNNLVGIPGVMHVAALASIARRSHYSNYGPGIGICAPTSNSHSYWRMTVQGLGITTTTGEPVGFTSGFGGTSSATPLVAGIAALVISANPALSGQDVIAILKQTAAKGLDMNAYPRTPPASFDPNPIWDISPIAPFDRGDFQNIGAVEGDWSPWFGHGRVDALDAVAEALRRRGGQGPVVFRQISAPTRRIPDNKPTGIRDTIQCPTMAVLSSIKVMLDITHPFIGDLRVTLLAPSGASVLLHDRSGAAADNIQATLDQTSTPGLNALVGQGIQGDWTLLVQDLAAQDTGRLNQWGLDITAQAVSVVSVEEAPGVTIPDNNPNGIQRSLDVAEAGQLGEIEVALDITHPFIGDLEVLLTPPGSPAVNLHNRNGGSTDNLIATYSSTTLPVLQAQRGQSIQGVWKLTVADRAGQDVGKLNRWALRITKS